VYVGGRLTVTTALATTIVAYEPLDNHNGNGSNVLFGDGHVGWIVKDAWPAMAAAAGVALAPSSTSRP
jgi:prepilin-type processing-associated H-X9-DG protein